jgi:hypothetical protein
MNSIIRNISSYERIKGCSDKTTDELLTLLLELPETAWESGEIYKNLHELLLDDLKFTPVINGKPQKNKSIITKLPNGIYKKLLVYTIIELPNMSKDNIRKTIKIFTRLEENAVTGFMYVSQYGRSFKPIKSIFDKTNTPYEIADYVDYLNNDKIDRGIAIHNTSLVFLAGNLLI